MGSRVLRFYDHAAQLPSAGWNRLVGADYPFLRQEFLNALETSGCVTSATGWTPAHAVLSDSEGHALAVAPLYLKAHSYGEFVFDFAWANASHRAGRAYYPKWLVAVPFTPSTGPRFAAQDDDARDTLIAGLVRALPDSGCSSLHALFLRDEDADAGSEAGGLVRHDLQFHWHARGDADFSGFLSGLSSDKRKKIQRERRRVSEAGIRFEWRAGDALTEAEWLRTYQLYSNTYKERGQPPYLTPEFFLGYGRSPGSPFRLCMAWEDTRMVAVAITVQGGDTLYGRHWGAAEHYHSLHFETCYYQGIEYCLREKLARFDAGAQGEHKLARGFDPVMTRSAHWLADRRLGSAVARALAEERGRIAAYHDELLAHSAYKMAPAAAVQTDDPHG